MKITKSITEFFIAIVSDRNINLPKKQQKLNSIITALSFSQHLTQGLELHDSQFLQLPYVDDYTLKKMKKKFSLKQIVTDDANREKFLENFSGEPKQQGQIKTALDNFPNLALSLNTYT